MAMNWPQFEEYNPELLKKPRPKSALENKTDKNEVFRLNKVHAFLICKSYMIFSCEKEFNSGSFLLRKRRCTPDLTDISQNV
jgi:hypothetical protein